MNFLYSHDDKLEGIHTNIQNNFFDASDLILKSWQPAHFLDVQNPDADLYFSTYK